MAIICHRVDKLVIRGRKIEKTLVVILSYKLQSKVQGKAQDKIKP